MRTGRTPPPASAPVCVNCGKWPAPLTYDGDRWCEDCWRALDE